MPGVRVTETSHLCSVLGSHLGEDLNLEARGCGGVKFFGSGSIWGESCFAVLLCASSCSPRLSRMASGQFVERLVRLSKLDFDEVLAIDE